MGRAGTHALLVIICRLFYQWLQWAERRSGVAEWIELARANTPGMLHEAREWLLQQLDLYRCVASASLHGLC